MIRTIRYQTALGGRVYDEARPGPWGPPELKLRENYDAIVARRDRGRA